MLGKRTWTRRLSAGLWLGWAALLLTNYYTQLWRLLAGDEAAREALVNDAISSRGLAAFWGAGLMLLTVQATGIGPWRLLSGPADQSRRTRGHRAAGFGLMIIFAAILATIYAVLLRYLFATAPLSIWRLPALDEALSRVLIGLFGAGLVLLVAQTLGAGICRLLGWHPDDWREGLLYRTALGLGAFAYLSLGLAALGLYYAVSVQILIAVVLLCGTPWFFFSRVRADGQEFRAPTRPASPPRPRDGDGVWQAIALLAGLIALVGALAPEIEYDALWYHLWLPKLWLEHGRAIDTVAEYISLYPLTWELVFGGGLALGGPTAAKLLHFACLPLTALLVYQFTLRFMRRASPWLAVALFVTIPTVLWEATTTYVDLALTFHVGLTVYALLRYVDERSRQWFAMAALNLGLAVATKHLGLFVLTLATGGLALRLWLADRQLRSALPPAVLLGLASLLLPLPWYIRSWLASSNPVFPDFFWLFGASPPERWNEISEQGWRRFEARFGRPRTVLNVLTLPWDMTVHGARYDGALGPMFLLLLPALGLLRRRAWVTPWLISFVLLYIALWVSIAHGLEMRFLIALTPLLAVLAAEACDRLALVLRSTVVGWARSALLASVAALLLLNLPPFTSLHEADRAGWDGWLTHVVRQVPVAVVVGRESQADYLVRSLPSYGAWRYINTHLPADARVLTFSGGDHLYSQRDRLWSDATMAYPAVWGAPRGQEQKAIQSLHRLHITHVLFDKRQLHSLDPDAMAIAQPSVMANWYDLEYEDGDFVLYRLRWEHGPPW